MPEVSPPPSLGYIVTYMGWGRGAHAAPPRALLPLVATTRHVATDACTKMWCLWPIIEPCQLWTAVHCYEEFALKRRALVGTRGSVRAPT